MLAFKSMLALALPLLAVANPLVARTDSPASTCNTGNVQCCGETTTSSTASPSNLGLLSLLLILGIITPNELVGLNCSPIAGILGGSNTCDQQTVCCDNNNFNGVVAVGCTPININL